MDIFPSQYILIVNATKLPTLLIFVKHLSLYFIFFFFAMARNDKGNVHSFISIRKPLSFKMHLYRMLLDQWRNVCKTF